MSSNTTNFTNRMVEYLTSFARESDFERIVRVVENICNQFNEPLKALDVINEKEMDSYFVDLEAKFYNIPQDYSEEDKANDIIIQRLSLRYPSVLTTLYLISYIFFKSQKVEILEGTGRVQILFPPDVVSEYNVVDEEEIELIFDDESNWVVVAAAGFNFFDLVTDDLAAGINYEFVESTIYITWIFDTGDVVIDDNHDTFYFE